MSKLGPSQRESVRLLIAGFSRKEIAARRGLAHSTIINHTLRARRRLGWRSVEQMLYQLGVEAK